MNKILLSKDKKPHKFDNLHKTQPDSFFIKKRKNNKYNKFNVPNNIKSITNRLYPKVIKTDTSEESKEKIIIIGGKNSNIIKLKNNNLSSTKNKYKKTK